MNAAHKHKIMNVHFLHRKDDQNFTFNDISYNKVVEQITFQNLLDYQNENARLNGEYEEFQLINIL